MLIRLCAHFSRQNMNGIDELIRIDGLPEALLFRAKDGKRYLNAPWEIDPDMNIPSYIREHCEPTEITIDLPKERDGVTGLLQTPVDTVRVLGVRLQLDNNPGKEMWAQIERIIEGHTPNDKKIPKPAVVAPNQKDPFFLEAKDIPVVDLRPAKLVPLVTASSAPVAVFNPVIKTETPEVFTCGVCQKSFGAQRGLWMHERKTRHKVKEPVAV